MNVYIVGVPTAGKSTLAKMLKRRCPQFNLVSFEAVRNGFIKTQPELEMGNRESVARREILPQYIVEFAEWNEKLTGEPTLIEGSFASAEQVVGLVRKEDIVVCLGYGGASLEEVAHAAISKAGVESYLCGKTEEEFMAHFYDLVDNDLANQEFCRRNNVPYYVTIKEREKVLEVAMRGIVADMK